MADFSHPRARAVSEMAIFLWQCDYHPEKNLDSPQKNPASSLSQWWRGGRELRARAVRFSEIRIWSLSNSQKS